MYQLGRQFGYARLQFLDLVRRADPFVDLERETFDEVLELAADGVRTGRGPRARYLHLDRVNGVEDEELASVRAAIDVDETGVVLTMLFLTDTSYEQARLRCEEEVVLKKVGHSTDS